MVYTLIVVQVRCVYACAPGHRPVVGSGLRSGVFTFNYTNARCRGVLTT
jgi:hypothetical protein